MTARHFLRDDDVSPEEQREILDLAARMKKDRFAVQPLAGPQTVAVIFDKTSTRTRVSFAVGIAELGGSPLIIGAGESQLSGKESPSDTARVLERMVSAIVWRTYDQVGLRDMAEGTSVPVINALSDDFHPCQLLADLQTIREYRGSLAGLRVSFFGDGASNMAQSWMLAGATAGMHVTIASPPEFSPAADVLRDAQDICVSTGASVNLVADPLVAAQDADVVVTDTWVSMGKEADREKRRQIFGEYRVDDDLLRSAKPDALFLHCLPAERGVEVTSDVLDGPHSCIWDEAENRLHAQKALLAWLLARSGR